MAYTPHEWSNGETITAAKLNNIEEGIGEAAQSGGGGVLIVDVVNNALNKTVQEIYDALVSGTPAYIRWRYGDVEDSSLDYYAYQWLCPIVTVYRYGVDVYRVSAVRTKQGNTYNTIAPQAVVFASDSFTGYAEFLAVG